MEYYSKRPSPNGEGNGFQRRASRPPCAYLLIRDSARLLEGGLIIAVTAVMAS
jgi:hypothetical protein